VLELTRFVGDGYDEFVPRHTSSTPERSITAPPRSRDVRSEESSESRLSCPTCGGPAVWRDNPQRPFCSMTCRLIDLGLWLDGRYRIDADDDPLRDTSNSE
jgi:endogenous inhibitor of DNA gyrase (YacG/DUF329 family)